jgi:hypothetical protein
MDRTRSPNEAQRKIELSTESGNVTVHIMYKDAEQTFSGKPEDVWVSINKFFSHFLPTFKTAEKLALHVDLQGLASQCEGLIAFSPEGPHLLAPRDRLTDNETLCLLLLAAYIGSKLNIVQKDTVPKDALQAKLGKDMKITTTRLGELTKSEIVMKTDDDEYKITTFGLLQMQKEVLPRIRAKNDAHVHSSSSPTLA